jgi:hypothetical protein
MTCPACGVETPVDSTRLVASLDPEPARGLLNETLRFPTGHDDAARAGGSRSGEGMGR